MTIIVGICILVGLVSFGIIKTRYYSYLIYIIGLTILLQITLVSSYLVGTDISLEYYFAQLAASEGWDSTLVHPGNSALGNVILVPFLSRVIPIIWIYKVLFPITFAFVPVVLYFIYKGWVNEKLAFLSSIFYIIVPTFFMELTAIARQQLATFFFVLVLYFVLRSNWKLAYKIPIVLSLSLLSLVSHYVFGLVLILFFGMGFIVKACLKYDGKFPVWAFLLVLLFVMIGSLFYYGNVASGSSLRSITAIIPVTPHIVGPIQIVSDLEISPFVVGSIKPTPESVPKHTPLMQFALGKDFFDVDVFGKIFRVLQYFTQVLLVVGVFLLIRKKDFLPFACAGIFILFLCILIPGFTAILNATRFYHIALLILSPALVVGGVFLFRNPRNFTLCLLIPYFLFTSGFVFEIIGQDNISEVTIPYSVALSDHRIDLGGGFTENDAKIRDWILLNDIRPIYADFYGLLFLQQYLWSDNLHSLPDNFDGGYVFLRERNTERGIVRWAGIGLRKHEELDVDGEVVYRTGNAMVIKIK